HMRVGGVLWLYLAWSTPTSPEYLNPHRPSGEGARTVFENVHHLKWLVITKPRFVDWNRNAGAIDVYVADVEGEKVTCAFVVPAAADPSKQGKFYTSSLWEDARNNLFRAVRRDLDMDGEL